MATQDTVGYYGKIPNRGDFIGRRVSREFTDVWDPWLQNALSCSRTQLNEKWLNVYLTSPIWRFALSPGMCGRQLWIGVVMPSVDKVGRYFPLTIVTPLAEQLNPFNIAMLATSWFSKAETIALSTLSEQNFDFDEFDKQVQALAADLPNSDGQEIGLEAKIDSFRAGKGWRFPVMGTRLVDQSYTSLLWQLANNRFSTYSLWWCDGSENIEPSMLLSDGLPAVESYAAMLDGKWQNWSWDDCPVQYLPEKSVETTTEIVEPLPDSDIIYNTSLDESASHSLHSLDNPNEPVAKIDDDWWTEEPDQLTQDAISHLAQNIDDDTPESLVLNTDPNPEEEILSQTVLIDPLDSTDQSLEQTQLIMDNDSSEILEKTMLMGDPHIPLKSDNEEITATTQLIDDFDPNNEPRQGAILGVLGSSESHQQTQVIDRTKIISSGVMINSNLQVESDEESQTHLNTEVLTEFEDNNLDVEDIQQSSVVLKKFNAQLNWVSSGHTDKGMVRKINEDAYLDLPKIGLWVVADGVGGHKSGRIASQMIVQQLGQLTLPENLEMFIESTQSTLQYVNRYLLENVSDSQEFAVGSTVAALLFYGAQAACVWAGDSRIYLNRKGKTTRLTKDHSMSEEHDMADANSLEQEIEPVNSNIITRAIGAEDLLELDIEILDLHEDDAFLLCSDGLYKEVSEEEIFEFLNREDSQVISKGLLDLALARNARDNVTVVSVLVSGEE